MSTDHPVIARIIALIEGWDSAGWGEYLLWETLEGVRDRPFKLMDRLPAEDLEACRQLRDELKTWVFWDGTTGTWEVVGIDVWRDFAKETKADDIRALLEQQCTKDMVARRGKKR